MINFCGVCPRCNRVSHVNIKRNPCTNRLGDCGVCGYVLPIEELWPAADQIYRRKEDKHTLIPRSVVHAKGMTTPGHTYSGHRYDL